MNALQDYFTNNSRHATVDDALAMLPRSSSQARRVLILSDIHSNWPALLSVLKSAENQECDTTWFLGDIVGYGPNPVECVDFHRRGLSQNDQWVAGNHDLGIIGRIADMPEMLGYDKSEKATDTWNLNKQQIFDQQPLLYDWLLANISRDRAQSQERDYGSFRLRFVHSNPDDMVASNLFPDEFLNLKHYLRTQPDRTALVVGHTHMVFLARLPIEGERLSFWPIRYGDPIKLDAGRYVMNPGSVGQPRDGDKRAAYAIWDAARNEVTFYRVEYDVLSVTGAMAKLGYSATLRERLVTGRIGHTSNYERVYRRLEDGSGIEPVVM